MIRFRKPLFVTLCTFAVIASATTAERLNDPVSTLEDRRAGAEDGIVLLRSGNHFRYGSGSREDATSRHRAADTSAMANAGR